MFILIVVTGRNYSFQALYFRNKFMSLEATEMSEIADDRIVFRVSQAAVPATLTKGKSDMKMNERKC